jgi:hypothetical protein
VEGPRDPGGTEPSCRPDSGHSLRPATITVGKDITTIQVSKDPPVPIGAGANERQLAERAEALQCWFLVHVSPPSKSANVCGQLARRVPGFYAAGVSARATRASTGALEPAELRESPRSQNSTFMT